MSFKNQLRNHCLSMPHSEPHYNLERCQLWTFEQCHSISINLYQKCLEYYTLKSQRQKTSSCIISLLYIYFNHHFNFTFIKPHNDICNLYIKKNIAQKVILNQKNMKMISNFIENWKTKWMKKCSDAWVWCWLKLAFS